MKFSEGVKETLWKIIDEMGINVSDYTVNPEKDFSRKKKWDFATLVKFIISMESESLKNELHKYFGYTTDCPSNASFNQRRAQVIAHVIEKGTYFLFRCKYINSNGIISCSKNGLPETDIFDCHLSLILTRKWTNEILNNRDIYRHFRNAHSFDFLDLDEHIFYNMNLRVVRFLITDNDYECILTNLPDDEFSIDEIKELYALRLGIETSFRELKYAVGLTSFHSKKREYIIQEIWARLVLYNFCEIITTHITIEKCTKKHTYQVNYTYAIHICRYFISKMAEKSPPDVEALISKEILPVRPGRHDPRKVDHKKAVSFLYRVA